MTREQWMANASQAWHEYSGAAAAHWRGNGFVRRRKWWIVSALVVAWIAWPEPPPPLRIDPTTGKQYMSLHEQNNADDAAYELRKSDFWVTFNCGKADFTNYQEKFHDERKYLDLQADDYCKAMGKDPATNIDIATPEEMATTKDMMKALERAYPWQTGGRPAGAPCPYPYKPDAC